MAKKIISMQLERINRNIQHFTHSINKIFEFMDNEKLQLRKNIFWDAINSIELRIKSLKENKFYRYDSNSFEGRNQGVKREISASIKELEWIKNKLLGGKPK